MYIQISVLYGVVTYMLCFIKFFFFFFLKECFIKLQVSYMYLSLFCMLCDKINKNHTYADFLGLNHTYAVMHTFFFVMTIYMAFTIDCVSGSILFH